MWSTDNVTNWIGRAAFALQQFYDPETSRFFRDSNKQDSGAMSTNRSFTALAEFLYFHETQSPPREVDRRKRHRSRDILEEMAKNYLGGDPDSFRSHSGSAPNPYTDAHALGALVAALGFFEYYEHGANEDLLLSRARELAVSLVGQLLTGQVGFGGGRLPVNPTVGFQVIRAIDAAASVWDPNADPGEASDSVEYLNDLVRDESRRMGLHFDGHAETASNRESVTTQVRQDAREAVIRQLGLQSGRDPEFDPGSLLAAVCLLQRFGGRSGRQLIRRGIEVLAESQDDDGSWRADLLTAERSRLVYVSSIEMATFMANLLIADLATGVDEFLPLIVPILEKSFAQMEAGYIDLGTDTRIARGWGNDRTRRSAVAEVWTTALALQFVIRLNRISQLVEQADALNGFEVIYSGGSRHRWPDLQGVVPDRSRRPEAIDWRLKRTLGQASDPTEDGELIDTLSTQLVRPILLERTERPGEAASLLLYGPPGTRKTSMVKAIARSLGWPLVVISPPDFLLEGIDGLERSAQRIFNSLNSVRRVVVLFDECEELLRRRLAVESPENRTHGAFITAGMLPRLQALRDRSWCVFAIVTNTELDELDPAVVRRGRLDLKRRVGHPTVGAQHDYLVKILESRRKQELSKAGLKNEPLSNEERQAIRVELEWFDESHIASAIKDLEHDRFEAKKKQKAGELRGYFVELSKLAAKDGDIPHATFGVLDEVAKRLHSAIDLQTDDIRNLLVEVTHEDHQ